MVCTVKLIVHGPGKAIGHYIEHHFCFPVLQSSGSCESKNLNSSTIHTAEGDSSSKSFISEYVILYRLQESNILPRIISCHAVQYYATATFIHLNVSSEIINLST
jgi:hypothetical protein